MKKRTPREFDFRLHFPDDDEPVAAFYIAIMGIEALAMKGSGYTLRYRGQIIWENGAEEIALRGTDLSPNYTAIYAAEKIVEARRKEIDARRLARRKAAIDARARA